MPRQEMLKVSADSSLLKHSDKQRVRAQRLLGPIWHCNFTDGETEAQRQGGSCPRSHREQKQSQNQNLSWRPCPCISIVITPQDGCFPTVPSQGPPVGSENIPGSQSPMIFLVSAWLLGGGGEQG